MRFHPDFPDTPRLARHRLISMSGGLVYHLRALRHARTRWQPFHDAVDQWLGDWTPPCSVLVLVGPSAGYSLPSAFLTRFERIVALEPDPLARWLLRRRLGPKLEFRDLDVLAGPHPLAALCAAFPEAAILFCNVLGQVAAPAGRRWAQVVAAELGGRHWASYHDVVCTEVPPRREAATCSSAADSLEAVLARFWRGGELPLVDLDTFGLGGAAPAGYAIWSIGAARHHLIEWTSHAPAGALNNG